MTIPSRPSFLPTADISNLQQRAELLQRVRQFFDQRGFFEVETPLLSHDIVVDRHLHPIAVPVSEITGSQSNDAMAWLQTSPEFGMKRLLSAGATAIYQIGKAFRQGELGRQHNPEFTMLEWYRVGDDLAAGMDLLDIFIQEMLNVPPAERLSYREAFLMHAGTDPFLATDKQLADLAAFSPDSKESADRDELLNVILSATVEPQLGQGTPTLLYDFPASQAALSKVRSGPSETPDVAERFEIYVEGVELANGYHELQDAEELLARNREQNRLRVRDGNGELPVDSLLIDALEHGLPPCAGVAVGIDRLVMKAIGEESLDAVIAFPFPRA